MMTAGGYPKIYDELHECALRKAGAEVNLFDGRTVKQSRGRSQSDDADTKG